ncbi:MAG TPA: WG repeat-containing protein, partial [Chryseosolibacter sp.]
YVDFNTFRTSSFENGLAIVSQTLEGDGLRAFSHRLIDTEGRAVLPFTSTYIGKLSEGLVPVKSEKRTGYVDEKGEWVFTVDANIPGEFHEGLARAFVSNANFSGWGFLDREGKMRVEPRFELAGDFSGGLAVVKKNNAFGFINRTGAFAVEPKFDNAFTFSNGLAVVEQDGSYGYINEEGKLLADGFASAASFSEGLAAVRTDDKYYYINNELKPVSIGQYRYAGRFVEGKAPVQIGENWGYIDKSGKLIIKAKYEEAFPFSNGLALVRLASSSVRDVNNVNVLRLNYAYIDDKGTEVYKWSVPKVLPKLAINDISQAADVGISTVHIQTIPQGCKVYFVPLDVWEDDKKIYYKRDKLGEWRAQHYTNNDFHVHNQVYMVFLESPSKKFASRKMDVHSTADKRLELDFSKESQQP